MLIQDFTNLNQDFIQTITYKRVIHPNSNYLNYITDKLNIN